MADYYSIHQLSKLLNVTPQTLRNWDKKGKLKPHHVSGNGYRYYSKKQVDDFLNVAKNPDRVAIGYCRVSTRKQKDDLDRQVENVKAYLTAQGRPFKIITDIGSGINYKKPGLLRMMDMIEKDEVEKVVVLYKDRLLRFGSELVEYTASLHGCKIEIIDSTDKPEEQELVEDLVQIVTVFSCRLQGKRAKRTKELIRAIKENEQNDPVI